MANPETHAVRLIVSGRVQGVGYRASCARAAAKLGLAGVVRNRPDGSVEVVAEGAAELVDELISWCRQGPPFASVRSVEVVSIPPGDRSGFRIDR